MARKNSHLVYYLKAFSLLTTPKWLLKYKEKRLIAAYRKRKDKKEIEQRVNYYNQLEDITKLPIDCPNLSHHTYTEHKGPSVYFFDTFEFTRYFPKNFLWSHKPGDIKELFNYPTIVKTRPLQLTDYRFHNSILLNLDKVRHFVFVKDPIPFEKKKPIVLFRGDVANKPTRITFIKMFKNKQGFDVGDTSGKLDTTLQARKLSINEHLKYRYVISLEGNDVASNLKWVMSSNCIAVMPRPTCESWFMEGLLKPNYHYIEIKPDFSDLEERIQFYNENIHEALTIIEHAHEYIKQFLDPQREKIISYLVMKKYFEKTAIKNIPQLL